MKNRMASDGHGPRRLLAGGDQERECRRHVLGFGVVDGDLRHRLGPNLRQVIGEAAVELAPGPQQQRRVGGVAYQGVGERQRRPVPFDEDPPPQQVGEPVRQVGGVTEQRRHRGPVELPADHGGVLGHGP